MAKLEIPSIVVQNGSSCSAGTVKSTVMEENNTARQKSKLYKQDEVQDVDDPIHFTETGEEKQSNSNGIINNGTRDGKSPVESSDSGNEQPAGGGGASANPKPRSSTKSKQLRNWRSSQGSGGNSFNSNSSSSLSRDSSYEAYTDTTGTNMEQFLYDMLNNKSASDRNTMLKIEKELVEFVNKPNDHKYTFGEMDSYHRMMVHRIAAYFGMEHNVDHSGRSIIVNKTKNTRIPESFQSKIVKQPEPQKSILKRDSGSLDEKEYRSSDRNFADSRRSKSFEEREEEYRKTRARIFSQEERLMDPSVLSGPVTLYGRTSDGSTVLIGSSRLSSQEDVRWMLEPRPWSSTDSDSSGRPIALPVKGLNSDIPIETMVQNAVPMVNGRPQIAKSHSDCHENLSVGHASRVPVTKSNSFSSVSYLQVEPPTSTVHNLGEAVISSNVNTAVQNAPYLSHQTTAQPTLNQPVPAQQIPQSIPSTTSLKHHHSNNVVPNSVVHCQDQATANQYPTWKSSNQNVEASCQTTPIDNSYQHQQYVVPGMESVPSGFPYCNPDGSYYVHNPTIKPIICQPPPNHNNAAGREVHNNFSQAASHPGPQLHHCNIPPPSVPSQQSQIIYYPQATHVQQDSASSEGDLTNRMSMMTFGQSQPMAAGPDNGASDSLQQQQQQQPVAVSTPVNNVTFSYVSPHQQQLCMMQPSAATTHVPQSPNSGQLTVYPSQQQLQYNNQPASHVYYSQALPLHNQVQHVPPPSNQYTSYSFNQVHQPEAITYNLASSTQASYQPQLVQSAVKQVQSSHLQYGYNPPVNHLMQSVQSSRTPQSITPVTQFSINQPQPFGTSIPQLQQLQSASIRPRQLIHSTSLGANSNIYQHQTHPITPSTTPSPQFQPQSFTNGLYNLSYPNAQVISGTSKPTITPPPNILAHISSSPQLTKSCSFPPMDGRLSTDHPVDSYTSTEYAVIGAAMHPRPKYPNHSPARPQMSFNRSVINRFGSQQWVHAQSLPQMPVPGRQTSSNRGRRNNRRHDNSNNNSNASSNRSSQNQTPTGRNNILEVQGFPSGMKQTELYRYLEEITIHGGKLQCLSSDGVEDSAISASDSISSTKHKVLAAFESDTSAQNAILSIKCSKFQLRSYHPSP